MPSLGCRQIKQLDLRKLDRHERTTLHVIPMLSVAVASRSHRSRAWCAFAARMEERQRAAVHAEARHLMMRGTQPAPSGLSYRAAQTP